jgi:hypothetical protein
MFFGIPAVKIAHQCGVLIVRRFQTETHSSFPLFYSGWIFHDFLRSSVNAKNIKDEKSPNLGGDLIMRHLVAGLDFRQLGGN